MSLVQDYYWRVMNARQPLPPAPSRQAVCQFSGSQQGLMVETSYGQTPYWEGVIGWFNQQDRQAIYSAKHFRNDVHCGVQLSGRYSEPAQFYQNFPGKNWSSDLGGFHDLLLEVIHAGFLPWVPLAGDGQAFDPVGLTYGWSWLMANLARVLDSVKDLIPYILFCPGYDGIIGYDEVRQSFGPWSLNDLDDFIVLFRSLAPNGHLSVEPSAGPINGTLPRFLSLSGYDGLDAVLNEFDNNPNVFWEGAARLLGPAYVRPSDQPPDNDPGAPFPADSPAWSCRYPTSRGPMYGCAFEFGMDRGTYEWVRGETTAADVQDQRQQYLAAGYPSAG